MGHRVILDDTSGFVEVVIGGEQRRVDAVTEFSVIQDLLKGRESMGVAANDYIVDHIQEKFGVEVSRGVASQYAQVITAAVADLKKNTPTLPDSFTISTATPQASQKPNEPECSPVSPDSSPKTS